MFTVHLVMTTVCFFSMGVDCLLSLSLFFFSFFFFLLALASALAASLARVSSVSMGLSGIGSGLLTSHILLNSRYVIRPLESLQKEMKLCGFASHTNDATSSELPVSRVEHVFNFSLVHKLWEVGHYFLELFHAQKLFVHIVQGSGHSVWVRFRAYQSPGIIQTERDHIWNRLYLPTRTHSRYLNSSW